MIVSGERIGLWVAKQLSAAHNSTAIAIGLETQGKIVAGVIYENWNGRSIVCHIAIAGQITPAYLAAIFDYPYNVADVEKIIAPVAESNAESRRLVEHMGFVEESRIKDAHPDGDILIYTLARDACRFLGKRYHGKISKPARSA